jgi:hypothetical protein
MICQVAAGRSAMVQRIGLVEIERLSTVGNTRCTVLLDHSSPTETGLRGSYLRDSGHVTQPSEWLSASPSDWVCRPRIASTAAGAPSDQEVIAQVMN